MNLQQLRYITAMLRHDLNVSQTAEALYTSQPGVSKQIRQLEDELGVELFQRSGKQISAVTPAGEQVIAAAEQALSRIEEIRQIGREYANPNVGELRIATTHTQARYVLPAVIEGFRSAWPHVVLQLHQGSPAQIAEMLSQGAVDLAIATEALALFDDRVAMPCYHWDRVVLVPEGHPLQKIDALDGLSLEAIAAYPLITYTFALDEGGPLDDAFRAAGLSPKVALTATDADVIGTYVRLGLGVGVVAELAVAEGAPAGLVALDTDQLFARSTTWLVLRRGARLRGFTTDFIERFAAHLEPALVEQAMAAESAAERAALFEGIELPRR